MFYILLAVALWGLVFGCVRCGVRIQSREYGWAGLNVATALLSLVTLLLLAVNA